MNSLNPDDLRFSVSPVYGGPNRQRLAVAVELSRKDDMILQLAMVCAEFSKDIDPENKIGQLTDIKVPYTRDEFIAWAEQVTL